MAAVAYLTRHPERPRAPIRVAFTVDEEVGRGAEGFDLAGFGADVAYTLDGSGLGELEIETFSAKSIRVTIRASVHPGTAKGKLVNAVKLAQLVALAARGPGCRPRRPRSARGTCTRTGSRATPKRRSSTSSRDHDDELLEQHVELLGSLVARVAEREPRAQVDVEVRLVSQHAPLHRAAPRVVEAALEAIRRAGWSRGWRSRGGTDGAVLSALGLPTPNIFTGGQQYHSVREWASVQDMAARSGHHRPPRGGLGEAT